MTGWHVSTDSETLIKLVSSTMKRIQQRHTPICLLLTVTMAPLSSGVSDPKEDTPVLSCSLLLPMPYVPG